MQPGAFSKQKRPNELLLLSKQCLTTEYYIYRDKVIVAPPASVKKLYVFLSEVGSATIALSL